VKNLALLVLATSCHGETAAPPRDATTVAKTNAPAGPTFDASESHRPGYAGFDDEVAFLRAHGANVEIVAAGTGHFAIASNLQTRVMTSEVEPHGRSLGFVHHAFIEAGKTGTPFDNYGGEDRFWLGPEGGPWGLYFPPRAPYEFKLWQTPHDLQEGALRTVHVTNHDGVAFDVAVERRIVAAPAPPVTIGSNVKWVGFTSENVITNTGARAWSDRDGMISIWILSMFAPSPDTKIIAPFAPGEGPIVNDRYFGKVPAERLVVRDHFIVMTADGNYRSKIGVPPGRARQAIGSYSPSLDLLTVVTFTDLKPRGYVNSLWEDQKDPLSGDAVNAYNDGPTEPGKPSLGGFYELETSSPALSLAPKASARHDQTTYHFVGDRAALESIAQAMLGVSLAEVVAAR
jgi:hypothetical protein